MEKWKVRGKLVFMVSIFVCFFLFGTLLMGNAPTVHAAEVETSQDVSQTEDGDGALLKDLTENFLLKLKAKYGDDYLTYYNTILEQWGSVENYLLSIADEEDPQASGWRSFISWLGEWSPVWGSGLAILGLAVIGILYKLAKGRLTHWTSGYRSDMKNVYKSINKIYNAQNAQSRALYKLLENEKFSEERAALEKSVKEIEENDDDGL